MTAMVSDAELLKKFRHGNYVTDDDNVNQMERLHSVGLIRFGYSLDKKQQTAMTTSLGKKFLKLAR